MKKPLYLGTFCIGTTPRIPTNSLLVRLSVILHISVLIFNIPQPYLQNSQNFQNAKFPSNLGKNQTFFPSKSMNICHIYSPGCQILVAIMCT